MDGAKGGWDNRILSEEIRRFVDYWQAKRGGARYPARAALDPVEFRYVLGDVVLVEVGRPEDNRSGDNGTGAWQFRYRLVGSNIVARDGYNLTGGTLDEVPEPQYRERIRATWTGVCETGIPAHHLRDFVLDNRQRRYEVVVLPLAGNGCDIDMLVSVQRELPRPE